MFPASSKHSGQAVAAFPDVCKTPVLGVPIPIPYANIGMATGGVKTNTATKTATKTVTKTSGDEAGLRNHLSILHQQLMKMPAGDATHWHAVLDDYVITTATLYKSLSSR